jgi:hypothetical protein
MSGDLIDLTTRREGSPKSAAPTGKTTGELLEDVGKVLARFVVLPSREAKDALALFTLHTWTIEAAHATPYIAIVSPEKQSGKTKLLEVLELLVRQPWRTASCTEAAMFRKIEQSTPTLLLDEIDALFNSNTERTEPLRAVLNAGNLRGSCATRVVGQGTKMEARDFSTFCPKVLAGINTGKLPETIKDRAVILDMKRRVEGEHVDRLRHRFAVEETRPLRAELEAWAPSVTDHLGDAIPELPDALSDRAGDAWEPLLAIADHAAGDWPARARTAAIGLSSGGDDGELGRGAQLLAAMRRAMSGHTEIFTESLLEIVNGDEDLPFGGWNEGKGLDPRGLARLLKPYGLKKTGTVRQGADTKKGYKSADLAEVWARYLPPSGASQASQRSHIGSENGNVTDVTDVTLPAGRGGLARALEGLDDQEAERVLAEYADEIGGAS